jgi:hypothetical protein
MKYTFNLDLTLANFIFSYNKRADIAKILIDSIDI